MAKPPIPSTPYYVRLLRVVFRLLSLLWPALGARIAYKFWFRSPRYKESRKEQRWRKLALGEGISVNGRHIATYRWGAVTPGYVLLVHGWSGRGAQLGGFVNPLNQLGLGVIAFDAPGHGFSAGHSTNMYQIADTVNEIVHKYGPPAAIIAHSFGCLVSAFAIRKFALPTEKLVLISAPKKAMFLLFGYQTYFRIPDRIMKIFHETMQRDFRPDVYQDMSTDHNLRQINPGLLMIHDKDDQIVGWEQTRSLSDELLRLNKNVKVFYTSNLGHTRILRDAEVIDRVVGFIEK